MAKICSSCEARGGKAMKLFDTRWVLVTGHPVEAALGLEDRMCVDSSLHLLLAKGVEGIQEEVERFCKSPPPPHDPDMDHEEWNSDVREVLELLRYIRHEKTSEKRYPNGIRDRGRGAVTLDHFLNHDKAREAHLSEAEVVALRLYSTGPQTLVGGGGGVGNEFPNAYYLSQSFLHNVQINLPFPFPTHTT